MSNEYDVLIRSAQVYDGEGSPPVCADVAIEAHRIARVGSLDGCEARMEVDASGLALAPGFIDVHTHDDFAALLRPDMGFKSRGGVTTCIVGNCGFGAAPFAAAIEMLGYEVPYSAHPVIFWDLFGEQGHPVRREFHSAWLTKLESASESEVSHMGEAIEIPYAPPSDWRDL